MCGPKEQTITQKTEIDPLLKSYLYGTSLPAGYRFGGSVGIGSLGPAQNAAMQAGLIEGPGTGTSDSIPGTIHQNGVPVEDIAVADGEFIMTNNAVRGAGDGNRELGAARMYELMRRFELRGER